MRALSFDTSSNTLHVSLHEDRTPVWSHSVEPTGGQRQAVASMLMPAIDTGMREAAWAKKSLDLIVVNTGPGSFTGIRVGIITARSLADAMKLPLLGISLLDVYYTAVRESSSAAEEPAAIVLSTTSNQFFFAGFRATREDPAACVVAADCAPADAMFERLKDVPHVFGDEKTLASLTDHRLRPLPFIKNVAINQAQLAYDRISFKRPDSGAAAQRQLLLQSFPWQAVLPLYLRNPSVTLKKEHANPHPPNERN